MAATCRDIITYAMRQSGVLASGENPTSEEAGDGLVVLQGMYDGWIASGMFGRLSDVSVTANYTANEGERVFAPAGVTVTRPTSLVDPVTQKNRTPRNLVAVETIINGARSFAVYSNGAWVELLGLTLDSTAPLSDRGAWGLAAALGVWNGFGDMFGAAPGQGVANAGRQFLGSLQIKLGATRDRAGAEYF